MTTEQEKMAGLDQVSAEIGALKATAEQTKDHIEAIFNKISAIAEGVATRNESTAVRLKTLEGENIAMKKDIEALTIAINGLSEAITNAKIKGWKMVAWYFGLVAASGGAGAASAGFLNGILF